MYLVDSIVKNVGGQYLEVFTKNLIPSFICVFEKVHNCLQSFMMLMVNVLVRRRYSIVSYF